MTLSSTTNRVTYTGAGSTGPYTYSFRIFAAADLIVTVRDAEEVETTLEYLTDYTVTGVGNASGTITLTTALAVGETLSIRRSPTLLQSTNFEDAGSFFARDHQTAFDRIVAQIQAVDDVARRSFGVSESYAPDDMSLRLTPETGKVLAWQSATELGNSTLDASATALPGSGRTVATLSAYLLNNAVANVKDYGALGDGVADDAAAFQAALDSGLPTVYVPAGEYKIGTYLELPDDISIRLEPEAILVPTNSEWLFRHDALTNITAKVATSGYTLGSTAIVMASGADAAAFSVNGDVVFTTDSAGAWPPCWSRVKSIVGATLNLWEPLPVTLTGTVTVTQKDLAGDCHVSGGVVDLTAMIGAFPHLIALDGYRQVAVEGMTFRGPMTSTTCTDLVSLTGNKRSRIANCFADDVICSGQAFGIVSGKHAHLSDLVIDGDCFGTFSSCDFSQARGITYTGRRKSSPRAYSIRAVKVQGERHSLITDVMASDCQTVIEYVNCGRGRIANIVGVNIGQNAADAGSAAVNIAGTVANGQLHTISVDGVNLENCGANAIIAGSTDTSGRIILSNVNIKGCQEGAILASGVFVSISDSIIEDWALGAAAGNAAIVSSVSAVGAAYHIDNVMFKHPTDPTRPVLNLATGPIYRITNISNINSNPLYDSNGTYSDVWIPADGSGAGLVFAVKAGRYIDRGDYAIAWVRVVYPVTADASAAEITGLPFTSSNADVTGMYASPVGFTDSALLIGAYVKANTTKIALLKAGGVQATNADMSGKIVNVCAVYRKA